MDVRKFLETEYDEYYWRTKEALNEDVRDDISFYTQFLTQIDEPINICEIGAANGCNLNYFQKNLNCKVSGIEPSSEAVCEGNDNFFNEMDVLVKGTSDQLPWDDESFDVVMFRFSLFWVGRKYLFRSISEADGILKTGGYLLITDFDTVNPYKRVNIHNKGAFTYKMNYSNLFLSNPQYYLVEKRNYSHGSSIFDKDIQERVSAQILYKD